MLCGTQDGMLCLFLRMWWSDISDWYPGHLQSINVLLKVCKDLVLMGSLDGLICVVQILMNMILGVLGSYDGFPVEDMKLSKNGRKMMGSISHDEYMWLWDASLLNDDDDEVDDDDGNDNYMQEEGMTAKATMRVKANNATRGMVDVDSEDGWEGMDKDEESDNEDMDNSNNNDNNKDADDSDDSGGGGKPKKMYKIFKMENELCASKIWERMCHHLHFH